MGEYMGSVSLTSRGLASHSHSSKMALSWLVKVSLVVAVVKAQEFQKEADKALNCPAREKARKGDRVFMGYKGLLGDGSTFDEGIAEFSLGEGKVIPGWEKGFLGQCAGESISMVIPPELGYGDIGADKVPAGSTLYLLTELRGIARTTKVRLSETDLLKLHSGASGRRLQRGSEGEGRSGRQLEAECEGLHQRREGEEHHRQTFL